MTALAAAGVAKACGDVAGGNRRTRDDGFTDERRLRVQDASLEREHALVSGPGKTSGSHVEQLLLSL